MSEPTTLDEAKKVINGLVIDLLETQRDLINAYKHIIDGNTHTITLEGEADE
jgi:hypothetical protein